MYTPAPLDIIPKHLVAGSGKVCLDKPPPKLPNDDGFPRIQKADLAKDQWTAPLTDVKKRS